MEALFEGSNLIGKNGTVPAASLSENTVVGVYFSAHWCPPCRGFTPKLAEAYTQMRKDGKKFEIVFVSSDKDEKACSEYHGEMPWLCLPYEKRDLKAKLSKKYKVSGIPSFILLDGSTGAVISKNGREIISKDMKGENFPWPKKTLKETIGDKLVKPDGSEVEAATALDGKHIGIYFSAHWCGPCKGFTPKLAETYNKVKAKHDDFEIVFVSADRDEKSFKDYHGSMPWLALPYSERSRESDLSAMFEVEGIPSLVIVGPDGKVINMEGVGAVRGDEEGNEYPWRKKPVNGIESCAGQLNEVPAVIVFDETAGDKSEAAAALMGPAQEIAAQAKGDDEDEELMFCTCTSVNGIGKQVRSLCELGENSKTAQMVLLDIPDEGGYYVFEGAEITETSVREFVADYKAKKLTRKQLSR